MQKVLIADDEQNIRNILDFSLSSEGFDVIAASSGEEAYTLAQTEAPALIILDVMMPGQGGVETCRRLKSESQTASIPVIMLTARSSREDRDVSKAAGADGYITKPFSPQKLIDTVQSILGVPNE